MPVTPQLLHELQAEEWGRQLLALVGLNPVKTVETVLNWDDLAITAVPGVPSAVEIFDAGWIIGISGYEEQAFNAGTSNEIDFVYYTDLESVSPLTTEFATIADLTTISPGSSGGVQVHGFPASGSDTAFTPVYLAGRFAVAASYVQSGTAATSGRVRLLFQHVAAA